MNTQKDYNGKFLRRAECYALIFCELVHFVSFLFVLYPVKVRQRFYNILLGCGIMGPVFCLDFFEL